MGVTDSDQETRQTDKQTSRQRQTCGKGMCNEAIGRTTTTRKRRVVEGGGKRGVTGQFVECQSTARQLADEGVCVCVSVCVCVCVVYVCVCVVWCVCVVCVRVRVVYK